jgi:hypothetical protein
VIVALADCMEIWESCKRSMQSMWNFGAKFTFAPGTRKVSKTLDRARDWNSFQLCIKQYSYSLTLLSLFQFQI